MQTGWTIMEYFHKFALQYFGRMRKLYSNVGLLREILWNIHTISHDEFMQIIHMSSYMHSTHITQTVVFLNISKHHYVKLTSYRIFFEAASRLCRRLLQQARWTGSGAICRRTHPLPSVLPLGRRDDRFWTVFGAYFFLGDLPASHTYRMVH